MIIVVSYVCSLKLWWVLLNKPTAKGLAKWYRGVWLGRTFEWWQHCCIQTRSSTYSCFAGNTITIFSGRGCFRSTYTYAVGFSTPVAAASTPSSVLVALSAPGIGESMMDAEVLPEAGQAGPTTMKPRSLHLLLLHWQVWLHQLQEDIKDQMMQVMKLLPRVREVSVSSMSMSLLTRMISPHCLY